MDAMPATGAIEQFLAALRQCAAEPLPPVVEQSIEAWLPYYRALPRVLGGNLWLAPQDREACFYLFARAILHDLLIDIEQYLSVMLRFLASNVEHSRVELDMRSVQGERRQPSPHRVAGTRLQTRAEELGKETRDATQGTAGAAGG
jgi:hypothetical protein